jgi:hypothetical protein
MLHSERTRAHSQDSVGGGGFWCRFGFLVLYLCVSAFFAAIFEWGIGRFQERRVATVNNFFTRKFKKNEKVSKVRGGSGSAIGVVGLGHGAARRSCPPSTFSVCAFCFLTQITTGSDVQYPARIEKTMTTARISAALQVTSGGGGAPRAPARARGARLPRRTRAGRDGGAAVPGMRKDGGMTVKIYTANCGNSPARSSPGAGAHGVMGGQGRVQTPEGPGPGPSGVCRPVRNGERGTPGTGNTARGVQTPEGPGPSGPTLYGRDDSPAKQREIIGERTGSTGKVKGTKGKSVGFSPCV